MADTPLLPPLFPEDRGSLPHDTRLVLCKLLTGPCVDPDSPLWLALLRDEVAIRSRLSDVFLELVIDRDRKVAFTRPAETGEIDAPVLQRSTPLSFLESVLLLYLRQALVDADIRGERAVVEEGELLEALAIYAGGTGTDQVLATKRMSAAIDKMRKHTILQAIRGEDRRFEVSPTLRLLFPAEEVAALIEAYRALSCENASANGQDDDDE
jgi:hypothetical protein